MLNKEKYADKIIRFFLDGTRIAVLKDTNEVVKCNSVCRCIDCKFNVKDGVCSIKKLQEWANAEYKEPILYEVEREYLSAVCKPYEVVSISKKISFFDAHGDVINYCPNCGQKLSWDGKHERVGVA